MECNCAEKIGYLVSSNKRKARRTEVEYQARLDTFRKGIVEGAHELVARHLYRCGVYQASIDNGLVRNPDSSMILSSLANRLSSTEPEAHEFLSRNRNLVEQQGHSVDPEGLLRGVLRHKGKATGLLEGNVLREVGQAEILIQRMKRLDEYLASWKESLRMEGSIELQKIVDMHS